MKPSKPTYTSLRDVLVSFGRRVLCYPLYRHFGMVSAAIGDATKILQSGKACVLKSLLDVHRLFRENEPAYILNDLYVSDYCVWIQRVKSSKMAALAGALREASLKEKDLGLELEELAAAAQMVVEEEEEAGAGRSYSFSSSSSSSSSSSDESEASEAEDDVYAISSGSSGGRISTCDESEASEAGRGGGCADFSEVGGGGGGGECKDSPLQPRHPSTGPPAPQEPSSALAPPARTVGALASASRGCRQLIQELEERVADGLNISGETDGGGGSSGGGDGGGSSSSGGPGRDPLLLVPAPADS